MSFKEIISKRFPIVNRCLSKYFIYGFSFTIVNILIRILDFSLIRVNHYGDLMSIGDLLIAISLDIMLSIAVSGLLLFPFIIISFFSRVASKAFLGLILSIYIILSFSLVLYFNETFIPLDEVIFIFDFESLLNIVKASGGFSLVNLIPTLLSITVFFSVIFLLRKQVFNNKYLMGFSVVVILISSSTNLYIISPKSYSSETEYNCNANKLIYFVKSIMKYEGDDNAYDISKLKSYSQEFQSLDPIKRDYIGSTYPFLYKREQKSNLAPLFKSLPNGESPNIVYIIVESLSHDLTGKDAIFYSLTPFLDSLSQKSLVWRNALSTSERTFGVLPALLTSLPPGEKGFMQHVENYPLMFSMQNSLARNNYVSNMYYGGYAKFTNIDKFVYATGLDTIHNQFTDYKKMPLSDNGNTWGYGDDVLFRASFPYIDSLKNYFSIYLTLSTHKPFRINNQEKYVLEFEKRLAKIKKSKLKDYMVKKKRELATFVAFDDELRHFFETYKKRPDFNKTIFVITGDHKGVLFSYSSRISFYHVPLIIYSPLLKDAKEFGGVVTHNDVEPSILSLMHSKYGLDIPKFSHSLGQELDTSIAFNANNRCFFMRNSRALNQYLYNDVYIDRDWIYRVNDNMELEEFENDSIRNKMLEEIKTFKSLEVMTIDLNRMVFPRVYDL